MVNPKTRESIVKKFRELGSFAECAKWYGISVAEFIDLWVELDCESLLNHDQVDSNADNVQYVYKPIVATPPVFTMLNTDTQERGMTLRDLEESNDKCYQVAVISDLHFGSVYQALTPLRKFVEICHERGVETLLCAGDVIEGLMPRNGHKNERFIHTIDDFEEYCADNYPDGFRRSYFIAGNHDASLGRRLDGYDIGDNLVKDRPDLTYLKDDPSLPPVIEIDGGVYVQLFHGNGGCTYARTNRMMSRCNSMLGMKRQFDILISGHCHHSSFIPNHAGVTLVGMPAFQYVTPYLAGKGLISECGGLILSYTVEKGRIKHMVPEFFFVDELGGVVAEDY